jgi:hypothetical protein
LKSFGCQSVVVSFSLGVPTNCVRPILFLSSSNFIIVEFHISSVLCAQLLGINKYLCIVLPRILPIHYICTWILLQMNTLQVYIYNGLVHYFRLRPAKASRFEPPNMTFLRAFDKTLYVIYVTTNIDI